MKIDKMIEVLQEAMEISGKDLDVVITTLHDLDEDLAVMDDPIVFLTLSKITNEFRIMGTKSEKLIETYSNVVQEFDDEA